MKKILCKCGEVMVQVAAYSFDADCDEDEKMYICDECRRICLVEPGRREWYTPGDVEKFEE